MKTQSSDLSMEWDDDFDFLLCQSNVKEDGPLTELRPEHFQYIAEPHSAIETSANIATERKIHMKTMNSRSGIAVPASRLEELNENLTTKEMQMNKIMSEVNFDPCIGCSSHYLSLCTGRTNCNNAVTFLGGKPKSPECYEASDERTLPTDNDNVLFCIQATNDVGLVVKEYCQGLLHISNSVSGPNMRRRETEPVVILLENLPELIKMLTAISESDESEALCHA